MKINPNALNQNGAPEQGNGLERKVPVGITKPVIAGILVMGAFFAGFGYWSVKAPLSGAAIAPGIVVVSGQNQDIDHLEGGIIREIAVKEGELVKEGQELLFLDETQAVAERNRVNKQLVALTATIARSTAELTDLETIEFPQKLVELAEQNETTDLLERQKVEFQSRINQHKSELGVLDEQVQAIEEEMEGINRQIDAEQRKLVVLQEEISAKKSLLERGLTPRNTYNALLREEADTEGAIGRLTATIGQRKKSIAEVRVQQETIRASRKAEASAAINETQTRIDDLEEQLTSRAAILNRMVIRAPVQGVIVNITKNTIGSVVRPGETVMEIQPSTDDLIISARIAPQDVDIVSVGQNASIRFSALNTRITPEVDAKIEYLSADRLVDEATQEPYFDARLRLSKDLPDPVKIEQIYPGMPVDAFIKTGDRTFLEYLAKPITDSFSKAFREE